MQELPMFYDNKGLLQTDLSQMRISIVFGEIVTVFIFQVHNTLTLYLFQYMLFFDRLFPIENEE
jgi:hypothetical protein